MPTWDVIVLGTGGVGSAAAMHLAERGAKVLAIEQFDHGHNRGSSHGQTRAIRMAYFEHPDYVPLLRRAYELWDALEERCGQTLFHKVGLLEIGPADGIVVPGVRNSAQTHHLPVDELTAADVAERFPGFNMPADAEAVFERNAGFLLVEDSVLAHVQQARNFGAELRTGEPVVQWSAVGNDQVQVRTTSGEYHAARLVITAGAWAKSLLAELRVPLRVLRKHLHWYEPVDDRYRMENGAPTFFFELPDRSFFYGFPQIDSRGVKIAEHSGGEEVADPATLSREIDDADRARVESFLQAHMPGVSLTHNRHCTCMYTMTPDEHFIVDRHPQHPQISFAAGLSGHGFKFTPVLGQALADLALDGASPLPIRFLACR